MNLSLHEENSDESRDENLISHPEGGGNFVSEGSVSESKSDGVSKPKTDSAEHLSEGDVFSIYGLNGGGVYQLAKIVKMRHNDLHIFAYDESYSHRPSSQSLDSLLVLPNGLDARRSRAMYYPVSRMLFSLMRPIFMGNRPVKDIELNGYRQWCLTEEREVIGKDICLYDELEKNVSVYLRIFFSYAVPTSLSYTIYVIYMKAYHLIIYAVLTGIVFGVIMMVLQWTCIRRQRRDLGRVSAATIQFVDIELAMPFQSAFELGVQALGSVDNCSAVAVDPHGGTIEARVARTIIGESQEILMVFSKINDLRTSCIVWSESPSGVIVDMGKNLGNVNAIISYLKSSANLKQPISHDLSDNKATTPDQFGV